MGLVRNFLNSQFEFIDKEEHEVLNRELAAVKKENLELTNVITEHAVEINKLSGEVAELEAEMGAANELIHELEEELEELRRVEGNQLKHIKTEE